MADETDSQAPPPLRFLALPGELKNRIYRLVLVQPEDTMINVTSSGYDRGGGLVQTCKEIRSEALKIFYYENTFVHHLRRFDSTLLVKWRKARQQMGIDAEKTQLVQSLVMEPCWPNLMTWLRRIHRSSKVFPKDYTAGLRHGQQYELQLHLIAAMFHIIDDMRGQRWKLTKKVLLELRPSLIHEDATWARD